MKEDEEHKLLIRSASQIVQVVRNGERFVKGKAFNNVAVLDRTTCSKGLSLVVGNDGKILDFDTDEDILEKYKHDSFHNIIDAHGKCILPGFVDAHTHPVWSGDRVKEFSMKLAGFSYMDIHKIGGGINYTVEQTKQASEKELKKLLKARLNEMLKCGTTLVEAKSGYGLETDTEMKLLRVIEQAKKECPIEISSTFCGAHSVPQNMTSQEATEAVLNEQIPALRRLMDAGEVNVDSIDVFCEKGVFDLEQSRQILQAGRDIGLRMNFHGDELHPMDGAKMGGELKAEAISHVEKISDEGIKALAENETVAIVLPTTAYMLRLDPPPIQKMIEAEVPIALGTDFNPNAFCYSMPITMNLACLLYKMTMDQALNAATINAAAALGKSHSHGSIERGKVADFVIANASRWEHIIYQLGAHDSLIHQVIKNGEVVHENPNSAKLI